MPVCSLNFLLTYFCFGMLSLNWIVCVPGMSWKWWETWLCGAWFEGSRCCYAFWLRYLKDFFQLLCFFVFLFLSQTIEFVVANIEKANFYEVQNFSIGNKFEFGTFSIVSIVRFSFIASSLIVLRYFCAFHGLLLLITNCRCTFDYDQVNNRLKKCLTTSHDNSLRVK